ncbi:hypothetical protein EJD97_015432 [Solanum chilense]|uniref:TF-B3 domain-containing protein n=1 Tax=Solanum chilense TaxID=4083 RepID=A0A6N2B6Z2_SOLCI|nr:hypothetical protein EJD97_015432 [Solanum chilense]
MEEEMSIMVRERKRWLKKRKEENRRVDDGGGRRRQWWWCGKMFKHEGDMKFDVFKFDSSHHCDKEYEMYQEEDEDEDEEDEDKHLSQYYFECTIRQYCLSRGKGFFDEEAAYKDMDLSDSHFICSIRSYSLSKHFLCIPRQFAIKNRLSDRKYLRESSSLQPEVKKKRSKAKRKLLPQVSVDANSHFISTIKPYTINNPVLRREMILIDEKRRSWSVWIGRTGHHFAIKRGWTQYNKFKWYSSRRYKFELTNNDTIPIVHFHCKYSGN